MCINTSLIHRCVYQYQFNSPLYVSIWIEYTYIHIYHIYRSMLTEGEGRPIVRQLAEALQYIHSMNITHRYCTMTLCNYGRFPLLKPLVSVTRRVLLSELHRVMHIVIFRRIYDLVSSFSSTPLWKYSSHKIILKNNNNASPNIRSIITCFALKLNNAKPMTNRNQLTI